MKVPSVNELMNPVLRAIRALDGVASKGQIADEIIRDLGLSAEVVSELREAGTETRLNTRLTMALSYLKSYGVIDNPRISTWALTGQGRATAEVDAMAVARAFRLKNRQAALIHTVNEEIENTEEVGGESKDDAKPEIEDDKPRESIEIQGLVAQVGKIMGMDIWVPAADRARVSAVHKDGGVGYLETLPLNYGNEPLNTIEQIDVIWIKGNAIERAFEIEHTTAIYSGILRMADLMALLPNLSIKLHILAPDYRREQVLREIRRPVFRQLPSGPLSDCCTYISYGKFRELADIPALNRMSSYVVDDYAESAA